MKRKLFTFALAALTIGLLGSCSKMNERIDGLDQRVGNIENEKIASIENQIAAINSSIADLGTIRKDITDLQVAVGAKGEDISELKAADEALGQRIDELKAYVGDLSKYAETDWVTATFATLEKLNETNTALSALEEKINKLGETTDAKIAGLKTKLTNAIDSAISGINATISTLEGRISALEQMIQTVTIVPAYSDGSVEVDDKDSLYVDFIVNPATVVARLDTTDVVILVNKVKTKAFAGVDSIKIGTGDLFEKDTAKGTVSVRVSAAGKIPAVADSTITVAVNIKNGISDFTTKFVPVYVASAPSPTPTLPDGALAGKFTVNAEGKQVYFSKGNLQATYNSTTSSYTWGFAANQHDYIGNTAGNTTIDSQTDGAVVDLFGWSTESTDYGISTSFSDEGGGSDDYSGEFVDWGKAIIGDGNTWGTLTIEEWQYLINKNNDENIRKGKYKSGVTVCSKKTCLVLAPDDFTGEIATSYDAAAWESAEAAGLVCLPAAGQRQGSDLFYVGDACNYWSSTTSNESTARFVLSTDETLYFQDFRCYGFSVRLITDVK